MRLLVALACVSTVSALSGCAISPESEDTGEEATGDALKCNKHRYLGKMGAGVGDKDLDRKDRGGYETFANQKSCDEPAYALSFVQRTDCSTGFRVDRRKGTIYYSSHSARIVYGKWEEWVFDRELCLYDATK